MARKKLEITVTPEAAGRVDRVVQALTKLTRSKVRGLFDHGQITINGEPCAADFTRVEAGDVVAVHFDPQNIPREKPTVWKDTSFRLVYEDDHLIVVDKAAWVLTVPEDEDDQDAREKTLVEAVRRYLTRSGRKNTKPVVVQRLDRGTSGLLVFAKNQEVGDRLRTQFAAHKPRREYVAVVAGLMETDAGKIESHLATGTNLTRYSTPDKDKGELAVTHYKVEKRAHGLSLVRCRLETGRRNQIRVQLAEMGHPVLGDHRYRPDLAKHPSWRLRRLALHAGLLSFTHPMTAVPMHFDSPTPESFLRLFPRGKTAAPSPAPKALVSLPTTVKRRYRKGFEG